MVNISLLIFQDITFFSGTATFSDIANSKNNSSKTTNEASIDNVNEQDSKKDEKLKVKES